MDIKTQILVFSLSLWGIFVFSRIILLGDWQINFSKGERLYWSSTLYSSLLIWVILLGTLWFMPIMRTMLYFLNSEPVKILTDGVLLILCGNIAFLLYWLISEKKQSFFYTATELGNAEFRPVVSNNIFASCLIVTAICTIKGDYTDAAAMFITAIGVFLSIAPCFLSNPIKFLKDFFHLGAIFFIALFAVLFTSVLIFVFPDYVSAASLGLAVGGLALCLFCLRCRPKN